jgi:hypothetical protein
MSRSATRFWEDDDVVLELMGFLEVRDAIALICVRALGLSRSISSHTNSCTPDLQSPLCNSQHAYVLAHLAQFPGKLRVPITAAGPLAKRERVLSSNAS